MSWNPMMDPPEDPRDAWTAEQWDDHEYGESLLTVEPPPEGEDPPEPDEYYEPADRLKEV